MGSVAGMDDAPIEPDTKNWTWVLERPCPDCGFDAASIEVSDVGATTRSMAESWRRCLAGVDVTVRTQPDRWSVLEYACHVRDVFRLFDQRLELMLTVDDPMFENWDQDATAIADDYASQVPAEVAAQLVEAAHRVADRFDSVQPHQYARTGVRSDGAVFTVESFAKYFLHDPLHHLWDVA